MSIKDAKNKLRTEYILRENIFYTGNRLRAFTNKFFHASISQSFLLWFPNCVTPLERFSVLYGYIYFKISLFTFKYFNLLPKGV